MSARLSARKLAANVGEGLRPILTRADLARAAKEVERRFGQELSAVDAEAMSAGEREFITRSLIRLAEARRRFGMEPYYPFDDSEYHRLEPFPISEQRRGAAYGRIDRRDSQRTGLAEVVAEHDAGKRADDGDRYTVGNIRVEYVDGLEL